jgi:beta-N-acetylhexosaminidase
LQSKKRKLTKKKILKVFFYFLTFIFILSFFIFPLTSCQLNESTVSTILNLRKDNDESPIENKNIKNESKSISNNSSLTEDDLKKIDQYVSNISIEDGIGQLLMVGIPADVLNYQNNKYLEEVICDLEIGNVFANTYNYFNPKFNQKGNENIFLSSVISFHNYLQNLTQKTKIKIPLLVGANFEGQDYSSINQVLIQPPSELSLGSIQDGKILRYIGRLIGNQLRLIGINLLFGPVLDIDLTEQGQYSKNILNRSYGSNPERISKTASYYITGLKESGIGVIGKHYPGFGFINESETNDGIAIYTGNISDFYNNLIPFQNTRSKLDGVMTAHLKVAFDNSNQILTFSKKFITDILKSGNEVSFETGNIKGINYSDQIVVTDDLSNMDEIIRYMNDAQKTYSQIAIEAFDAGHDLILYSHVEIPGQSKKGKYGSFTLEELSKVKDALINHIKSSKTLENQFRQSLKKIIILKAKLNKNYNFTTEQLIEGSIVWNTSNFNNFGKIVNPDFLKEINLSKGEDLIKQAIDLSAIEISKNTNYNLSELNNNERISFYVDKDSINLFEDRFKNKFPLSNFRPISRNKEVSEYNDLINDINIRIKKDDLIIYTLNSIDDANILDRVRLNNDEKLLSKLIIIVHNTPKFLNYYFFYKSTVLGTLTNHPLSYITDLDFLSGILKLNPIKCLPINLGVNNSYYVVNSSDFNLDYADEFEPINYFATQKEKELQTEVNNLITYKDLYNKLDLEHKDLEEKYNASITKNNNFEQKNELLNISLNRYKKAIFAALPVISAMLVLQIIIYYKLKKKIADTNKLRQLLDLVGIISLIATLIFGILSLIK